jgi:hypothetical protein
VQWIHPIGALPPLLADAARRSLSRIAADTEAKSGSHISSGGINF